MLLLKYTEDFSMLIHCLDALAYVCRTSLITSTSPCVACQNKIELLANIRFEIVGTLLHIDTPLMRPFNFAFANSEVKPLAHNKNKYGEKGSTWQIPLDGLMLP